MCLGLAASADEFLEITATDNDGSDALPNDEWQIGTGVGTKTACLTKTVKGNLEELIGLFDMRFGYTVCILADPETGSREISIRCRRRRTW